MVSHISSSPSVKYETRLPRSRSLREQGICGAEGQDRVTSPRLLARLATPASLAFARSGLRSVLGAHHKSLWPLGHKSVMVPRGRIGLPTPGFSDRCSTTELPRLIFCSSQASNHKSFYSILYLEWLFVKFHKAID